MEFLAAKKVVDSSRDSVGPTLRSKRVQKQLSQREVAEAAGVTQAYLSYVESGSKTPTAQTLEQLIAALNAKEGAE